MFGMFLQISNSFGPHFVTFVAEPDDLCQLHGTGNN